MYQGFKGIKSKFLVFLKYQDKKKHDFLTVKNRSKRHFLLKKTTTTKKKKIHFQEVDFFLLSIRFLIAFLARWYSALKQQNEDMLITLKDIQTVLNSREDLEKKSFWQRLFKG